MTQVIINREGFLKDRQGRTFSDVVNDSELSFETVLDFFSDEGRQRRMEESEIHHDRPPLAGVVRELESVPPIDHFLASATPSRAKRLRQAVGVTVRIVMELRGWMKVGKKGCLGVRATRTRQKLGPEVSHNTGGLALWFLRAERYVPRDGMPFLSVRDRAQRLVTSSVQRSSTPGEAIR